MNNIGILLRGKSLEKLNLIYNKFDDILIVNDFKRELNLILSYINDKNIKHFLNSQKSAFLTIDQYKKYNISDLIFSFSKEYCNRNKKWKNKINNILKFKKNNFNFLNHILLPNLLTDKCLSIRNSGIQCILYVSEIIKPKIIYIAGLDFYHENYMIKKNSGHHLKKSIKLNLYGSFIDIVKNNEKINYKLITYYKGFNKNDLKLKNLEILKI